MEDRPACRHCRKNLACRPRRLCFRCHSDPSVRNLYPSRNKFASYKSRGESDPTEAELDATIAEQMKRLPAWWWKEKRP
jgi:hypothetical protein